LGALREVAAHFGVTFDDAALKKGVESVTAGIDKIKSFGSTLAGGLAVGALWHFTEGLLEEADALSKHSATLGISMKSLQEWQYMASLAGVSNEALQATFTKLSGGKGAKGLAALGVQSKKANGEMKLGPEILEEVAEKLSKIENPSERNSKAMAVLGKSYARLMPLLSDGKEGIAKLKKEFEDFGGGWGEETGKNAEEFNDNLTRVKFIWKSFTIGIISSVLPTLLQFSRGLIGAAKATIMFLKQGKMVEAVFAGAALRGIAFLSAKIGPLGAGLKMLTAQFFKVIVPLLILEDFLVFLAGGDSAFGRIVEKIFGVGTADKIRAWIGGVWKSFTDFINQLKTAPLSVIDDWELFLTTLKADVMSLFGPTLGAILVSFGQYWLFILDLMTGGWDNFVNKVSALASGFLLIFNTIWSQFGNIMLLPLAAIDDAYKQLWNGILSGAQKVLGIAGKVADVVGATGIAKSIAGAQQGIDGGKAAVDSVDTVTARMANQNAAYEADRQAIAARLNAGIKAGGITNSAPTVSTVVNVTVPPGTPAQQANAVGKAAASGAQNGLRGAKATLVPGG
jgi:hypothetical protein